MDSNKPSSSIVTASPDLNNPSPSNHIRRLVAALGFAGGVALAVSSSSSQVVQFASELQQVGQVGDSIERMLATGGLADFCSTVVLVGIIIGSFVNGLRR